MKDGVNGTWFYAQADQALSQDGTSLRLDAGHGERVHVGTLFGEDAPGKREVMKVLKKDVDLLTIERGYGETEKQEHPTGFKIRVISNPRRP